MSDRKETVKETGKVLDINEYVNNIKAGKVDDPTVKLLLEKHEVVMRQVQEAGGNIQRAENELKKMKADAQSLIGRAQELSELVNLFGSKHASEGGPAQPVELKTVANPSEMPGEKGE